MHSFKPTYVFTVLSSLLIAVVVFSAPNEGAAQVRPTQAPTRTISRPRRATKATRFERTLRKQISSARRSMHRAIVHQATTPYFRFFSRTQGARFVQTAYAAYREGIDQTMPAFNVSNLGPGGVLDLVALLPVSGHVIDPALGPDAVDAARHFARTNVYQIRVVDSNDWRDGDDLYSATINARGLTTTHRFRVALRPGLNTLRFWPERSGGPTAYMAGRQVKFTWDGT